MTNDDDMDEFYSKASSKANTPSTSDDEFCEQPEIAVSSRKKKDSDSYRRWASNDQKFWGCSATFDALPPGLYKPSASHDLGYYLERLVVDTDDLLVLPDTASEQILIEIEEFWKLKDAFDKRGFIHKRGILLWGDPGSGKTATIQLLIKAIIEKNGLAVFANDPETTSNCLQMIRRIEPTRPMIVVLEDIDALIEEYGEAEYLSILDGENQVSEVVYIATTNYPENLDKRLIDRPSRFDRIEKISMPTPEARRHYLTNKEPSLTDDELNYWVSISDEFSIAHLKEMIISNRCYGKNIESVVKRLTEMRERNLSSEDAINPKQKIGFNNATTEDQDDENTQAA